MYNAYSAKSVLVFGCGYLGSCVALRLLADGWTVHALTRSPRKADRLKQIGIQTSVGDWSRPSTLTRLPPTERTLIAIGWDRSNRASRYDVYVRGLGMALPMIHPATNLVYVSSTGVYHHTDGRWVDESSPCHPAIGSGGWAHLRAEERLSREPALSRITILRMAGLYGPNRVPHQTSIRKGEPIHSPAEGYLNLIHVDDAATAVLAAWDTSPAAGRRIFAVSDGVPVLRTEYLQQIARQLGRAPLTLLPSADDHSPHRRVATNKRVYSRRFTRSLCPRLMYPSYREGLRAILSTP